MLQSVKQDSSFKLSNFTIQRFFAFVRVFEEKKADMPKMVKTFHQNYFFLYLVFKFFAQLFFTNILYHKLFQGTLNQFFFYVEIFFER